jgi:outer membrane cobalamin receptor
MSPARLFFVFCFAAAGLWAADSEPVAATATEPVEKLSEFVVLAGRMPLGNSPGAMLNSVEVVSTPGAAADINRSLQTFPGVQLADEGNALFVRGGDSPETITLINGIRYPAATRLSAPTGSFTGSLDPFQAKTITFLNGGFGAEYGNVLSGIVDVVTRGAPSSASASMNLGLGAIGATGNLSFGHSAGLRGTAVLNDTAPIISLNGSSHDYVEKPNGHDFNATAAWNYSPDGEIKAFAIDQTNRLALYVNQPGFRGLYRANLHNQLATFGWHEQFGSLSAVVNGGGGSLLREETIPIGKVKTLTNQEQFNAKLSYDASERLQLTGGVDFTHEAYGLTKTVTTNGVDRDYHRDLAETRPGAFFQADTVVMRHVHAVVGGRSDSSRLTQSRTYDPRLSVAWEPVQDLSFSVAGGTAHQVPDAFYFVADDGSQLVRPAMRSQDIIFAMESRHNLRLLRIEAYEKHYSALAQLDRNYEPAPSGTGRARGADLFFKTPLPALFSGRLTYSFVNTERTDPNTGRMVAAPWDVTHTVTLVLERQISGWQASLGWRYGTGRPITPVVGGQQLADGSWTPIYGEPASERLPPLQRLDLLAYRTWLFEHGRGMTVYVSVNNVLNRENVYSYSYSEDYSQRQIVRSYFGRVLYFGAMFYFN